MRRSIVRFELPLGLMGAALVALAGVFAAVGIPTWIPPALSIRFGIASPFTGMTRSFVAMVSGHIGAAFAWHPLGPLVFTLCVFMPVLAIVSLVRTRRFAFVDAALSSGWLWLGFGVLTLCVWVRQIVSL